MGRIEGQIVIGRPVEAVFDFVADERNEPLYNPSMSSAEKVTEGPIGAGTRFVAFIHPLGNMHEMLIEFTAFDRPKSLSTTSTMSMATASGTLTFEPVPTGTLVRWSWQIRARGLMKLLAPILIPLARRQERVIWTSLKQHLETATSRA